MSQAAPLMDGPDYCREIEAYLCRKNDGHLIRIVGPAFEQVCSWAQRGVPLKLAFRGIDRYCDRYYAKGPRRRPVRVEFCEADVLDVFDDWRRAVGVAALTTAGGPAEEREPRRPALAAHIHRIVARLIALRAGERGGVSEAVDAALRELDSLSDDARHARGAVRERIVGRLSDIDRRLAEAAAAAIDDGTAATLRREAEAELSAFGARMAPDARARSIAAAFERLVRETLGLPLVRYD